jgi:predicted ArsR family transcriptional regulator
MKIPKWSKRFLVSTRGRIIGLLRSSDLTVNELAEAVNLTDNAVRSHLSTLERDGLVQQNGVRPGLRKPHALYGLTAEAEHLFPKAYAPLLNSVLEVLGENLPPETVDLVLREVGRRMAAEYLPAAQGKNRAERVALMQKIFGDLGGLAEMEQRGEEIFLSGDSCPLAAITAAHPQACDLVKALVAEVTGAAVQTRCKYDPSPQCCFQIAAATAGEGM